MKPRRTYELVGPRVQDLVRVLNQNDNLVLTKRLESMAVYHHAKFKFGVADVDWGMLN